MEHGAAVDQSLATDFIERGEGRQPHPAAQFAAGKLAAMGQHPGFGGALLLAYPLVKVGVDGGVVGEAGRRHEPAAPLGPVDEAVCFEAGERLLDGDAGGGETLAQGPLGGQLLPGPQLAAADIAAQGLANLLALGGAAAIGQPLFPQSLCHCHVPVGHSGLRPWSRPAAVGPEL